MFVQLNLVHSELYLLKTRAIVYGALFRRNCTTFEQVKKTENTKLAFSLTNNTEHLRVPDYNKGTKQVVKYAQSSKIKHVAQVFLLFTSLSLNR